MKDDKEKGLLYQFGYGFGKGVAYTILAICIAVVVGYCCGTLAGMAVVTYNAFVNMFI